MNCELAQFGRKGTTCRSVDSVNPQVTAAKACSADFVVRIFERLIHNSRPGDTDYKVCTTAERLPLRRSKNRSAHATAKTARIDQGPFAPLRSQMRYRGPLIAVVAAVGVEGGALFSGGDVAAVALVVLAGAVQLGHFLGG